MRPEKDPCCSVSRGCKASPGADHRKLSTGCFSCGLPVCTAPGCSIRTVYHHYGTQRICVGCLEMRQGDSLILRNALRKLYSHEALDDGHERSEIPTLVQGYMSLTSESLSC